MKQKIITFIICAGLLFCNPKNTFAETKTYLDAELINIFHPNVFISSKFEDLTDIKNNPLYDYVDKKIDASNHDLSDDQNVLHIKKHANEKYATLILMTFNEHTSYKKNDWKFKTPKIPKIKFQSELGHTKVKFIKSFIIKTAGRVEDEGDWLHWKTRYMVYRVTLDSDQSDILNIICNSKEITSDCFIDEDDRYVKFRDGYQWEARFDWNYFDEATQCFTKPPKRVRVPKYITLKYEPKKKKIKCCYKLIVAADTTNDSAINYTTEQESE
ncbi:hypothetical protein SAMN05216391_1223 [Lachnospiraceae bacterium KHCPX20]|nr:hypothetical protein SAMN05216391_1223 [Lachnospiraceae bacterium KHCPX20]